LFKGADYLVPRVATHGHKFSIVACVMKLYGIAAATHQTYTMFAYTDAYTKML
jgi:hypothetical protein